MREEKKLQDITLELLKAISSEELSEDLQEIFIGYLSSEASDNTVQRTKNVSTYFKIQTFLRKVGRLKSINRWSN
jgi:hypothetical protein